MPPVHIQLPANRQMYECVATSIPQAEYRAQQQQERARDGHALSAPNKLKRKLSPMNIENGNLDHHINSIKCNPDRHSHVSDGSSKPRWNHHHANDLHEQAGDHDNDGPSNELLLAIAFVTFATFSLTQLVFAFIAESEAMMGDSAAMIVDSITYLFNWVAERRKHQWQVVSQEDENDDDQADFDDQHTDNQSRQGLISSVRRRRIRQRNKRKAMLQLEIVPPLISLATLVMVTAWISYKAVGVLILDWTRAPSEQGLPNINIMMGFSLSNLLLDMFNVFCFARAKHLFGFATREVGHDRLLLAQESDLYRPDDEEDPDTGLSSTAGTEEGESRNDINEVEQSNSNGYLHHRRPDSDTGLNIWTVESGDSSEHLEHTNLNMCSAYTHVFADTLRSIAVLLSSAVAELSTEWTPEEADATAAVVVSILILLSLIPLLQGLWNSFSELRDILEEERGEQLFDAMNSQLS